MKKANALFQPQQEVTELPIFFFFLQSLKQPQLGECPKQFVTHLINKNVEIVSRLLFLSKVTEFPTVLKLPVQFTTLNQATFQNSGKVINLSGSSIAQRKMEGRNNQTFHFSEHLPSCSVPNVLSCPSSHLIVLGTQPTQLQRIVLVTVHCSFLGKALVGNGDSQT